MCWTVLGAGVAEPHPSRAPAGHLLEAGGTRLLIDLGPGTLWRLASAGCRWQDLDALLISHVHLDHLLDLPALMFASRLPGHGRSAPLPIVLHPAALPYVERLRGAFGRWFEPEGFEVRWEAVAGGSLRLGEVEVTLAPVEHHASSLGMRFAWGGRSVAYSGDSDYCEGLVALCRGASLAVVECSTPVEEKAPGHLSPREVAWLGQAAQPGRLALVHRYASLDGVDVPAAVRAWGYEGEVVACEDGERLAVSEVE